MATTELRCHSQVSHVSSEAHVFLVGFACAHCPGLGSLLLPDRDIFIRIGHCPTKWGRYESLCSASAPGWEWVWEKTQPCTRWAWRLACVLPAGGDLFGQRGRVFAVWMAITSPTN